MGHGSFLSISCNQKTNCKSSCEDKLLAVDDCIGSVLRVRHFLLAQGYKPAQTRQQERNFTRTKWNNEFQKEKQTYQC